MKFKLICCQYVQHLIQLRSKHFLSLKILDVCNSVKIFSLGNISSITYFWLMLNKKKFVFFVWIGLCSAIESRNDFQSSYLIKERNSFSRYYEGYNVLSFPWNTVFPSIDFNKFIDVSYLVSFLRTSDLL